MVFACSDSVSLGWCFLGYFFTICSFLFLVFVCSVLFVYYFLALGVPVVCVYICLFLLALWGIFWFLRVFGNSAACVACMCLVSVALFLYCFPLAGFVHFVHFQVWSSRFLPPRGFPVWFLGLCIFTISVVVFSR